MLFQDFNKGALKGLGKLYTKSDKFLKAEKVCNVSSLFDCCFLVKKGREIWNILLQLYPPGLNLGFNQSCSANPPQIYLFIYLPIYLFIYLFKLPTLSSNFFSLLESLDLQACTTMPSYCNDFCEEGFKRNFFVIYWTETFGMIYIKMKLSL